MNGDIRCPECNVGSNSVLYNRIYFFECGNAYNARWDKWADMCCSGVE